MSGKNKLSAELRILIEASRSPDMMLLMERHKDALKKARQSEKRKARNQSAIAKIKTLRKSVEGAGTPEEKKTALARFASAVGKARTKGILHPNTASRIVSRTSRKSASK